MSTHSTVKLAHPASTHHVFGLFNRYRDFFRERRQRARLQATLSGLDNRELQDIGISRGEIDYVASNRSFDPRHIRPAS
jgi:uncharacterized protein YjiS (DUF1127 family)